MDKTWKDTTEKKIRGWQTDTWNGEKITISCHWNGNTSQCLIDWQYQVLEGMCGKWNAHTLLMEV